MNRTVCMVMRERNDNKLFRMNRMKVRFIAAAFLFLLLILSVCFFTKTVTAQRSNPRSKLVASVEVKKGDTLWSIASEYMSDDYENVNEYIDEIKASNGLTSDKIHAGNYIIVPYYADASY